MDLLPPPDYQDDDDEEPSQCTECMRPIPLGGGTTTSVGRFHNECLMCANCNKALGGNKSLMFKQGYAICDMDCAQAAFCSMCDTYIGEDYITYGGARYHADCLVCAGCTNPVFEDLDGDGKISESEIKFSMKKGKIVHDEACAALIFCHTCDNLFDNSEVLDFEEFRYHPKCLNCAGCHKSLMASNGELNFLQKKGYYVHDEQCGADVFCGRCDEPLNGPSADALGRKWHFGCLNCASCKQPVVKPGETEVSFAIKNDLIVHDAKCAAACFCMGCDKFMPGQRLAAEGGYWHPACFTCTNCKTEITSAIKTSKYPKHRFCQPCADKFS